MRTGATNFTRAQVPWGFDLAAAWSWRLLVIAAAVYLVAWLFNYFLVVTMPLVIALLIATIANSATRGLERIGIRRGFGAAVVVLTGLVVVGVLLTFVGQQVASGATDLANQVVKGLGWIKDWLKNGPLNATDSQINTYIERAQSEIQARAGELVTSATHLGTTVGHVFAGTAIALFATYFFVADGARIWAFVVRLAPRAARERVDSSGKVAWQSLTQFVKATVLVALVDSVGIMIAAAILGVPFIAAIGVLVFIGAFVPMVGALVAGGVAVLVALVSNGPINALLMLLGVIIVQQIEGHVLQPFLMGRFVSVHPLAIIVAIGCGVLVAGIPGALIAVPLVAVGNAVGQHLAENTAVGEDPLEQLNEEIGDQASDSDPPLEPEADAEDPDESDDSDESGGASPVNR